MNNTGLMMLHTFNILANSHKRKQAVEDLRNLISNSETSIDSLMHALYVLYPLPEIQSIYSFASSNKAIFLHRLLDFIQFRILNNHPADPYLDIISLSQTISAEVERNLITMQEASLRQQEMYHLNQNFILKYNRKENISHENIMEISSDIRSLLQDNINVRYKIRNIMRNGSRLLLIKLLLRFESNQLLQPTEQDIVYCDRLHAILDNVQVEIRTQKQTEEIIDCEDFGSFAELAIELDERELLADCIKLGASLYNDSYFIHQAGISRENGNLEFADLLDQMTTDPEANQKKFLCAIQELDYKKGNELLLTHPALIDEYFNKIISKLRELQKTKVNSKAKFSTAPEPFETFIKSLDFNTDHLVYLINIHDLHIRLKRIIVARIANLTAAEHLNIVNKLELNAIALLYLDPTNNDDNKVVSKLKKIQINLQGLANDIIEKYFIGSTGPEIPEEIKKLFDAKDKQIIFGIFRHLIFSDSCADIKRFSEILSSYTSHASRKGFELQNLMNNEGHDLLCESLDALRFEKMTALINHDFPLKRTYKINNIDATITQMIMLLLRITPEIIEKSLDAIKIIAEKSPNDMHYTPHNHTTKLSVIQHALMIQSNKKNDAPLRMLIGILLKSCPDQTFGLNGQNIFHYIGLNSNPSCLAEVCEYLSQAHESSKIYSMLISKNKQNMTPTECAMNHVNKKKQAQMAALISAYINIFSSSNQKPQVKLTAPLDNRLNYVASYTNVDQFNDLIRDNPEHSELIAKHLQMKIMGQSNLEDEASWVEFIDKIEIPIKHYKVFLHQSEISIRLKPYFLARMLDEINFGTYSDLYKLDQEIDIISTAKNIFTNINGDFSEQLQLIINVVTTASKYCTSNEFTGLANILYEWSASGAKDIYELDKIFARHTHEIMSIEPNKLPLSDLSTMYLSNMHETFLHHMLDNHDEDTFLKCLKHIMSLEYPGIKETILFAMNAKGNNLYSSLECRRDYWKDAVSMITDISAEYISSKIKSGNSIYKILPYKINFYSMYESNNIIERLLSNRDYSRLLIVLEDRFYLAGQIKQQTFNLSKKLSPEFSSAFETIDTIFGRNYLLDFRINKMRLMNYITQQHKHNESTDVRSHEALSKIIDSQLFRLTIASISVLCTDTWNTLMQILELKACDKSLTNHLVMLQQHVHDFKMDINRPNNKATPLRQAILKNSLVIIKFLCDKIGATVDAETMLWSLTFANNTNVEILEYLTKRYNLHLQFTGNQTASERLIKTESETIMLHTLTSKDAVSKLNWLISAGCNIEATYSKGENIVQKLISLAFVEEDLLDVENIMMRMRVILNNPETKKRLLTHEDKNGKTISDYVSRLPSYCDPVQVVLLKKLLGINSLKAKATHKPKF